MLFVSNFFSRQLAEEVLKTPPTSTDDEELEMSGFEGMEVLAKAIEASENINILHVLNYTVYIVIVLVCVT